MSDVEMIAGDLPVVTRHIDGWRLTIQRVRIRLSTHLGEWILDTGVGLPFIQWAQMKPPPVDDIIARVRLEIEDTPGVIRVASVTGTANVEARRVALAAQIVIEDADLQPVTVGVTIGMRQNSSPQLTITQFPTRGIIT